MVLLVILFLVVFVLLSALVLKWSQLVLLNRSMQERSDLIALAATAMLLDEDLLCDAGSQPKADQSDDVDEAFAVADRYRRLNNCLVPYGGVLDAGDVHLAVGYIGDVSAGQSACFRPALDKKYPLNTIRVACLKNSSGPNPVSRFVRTAGCANACGNDVTAIDSATVSSHAQASLDNLVVGFQPTYTRTSPLAPIAVQGTSWQKEHCGDRNHNGISERELRLAISGGKKKSDVKANCKLVALDNVSTLDDCCTQLLVGVEPADLPGSYGQFGPATAKQPLPLPAITILNVTAAQQLADRLNEVAASADPRRAFCVFHQLGTRGGQVPVVGFVAACVLGAHIDDDQLVVTVEPCFLIHPTLWTASASSPPWPQPNLYLHKLRLTR